jgi:hypothetical protein
MRRIAAYAIRLGRERLPTPYGAGHGPLFASNVAETVTTPTEAELEERPAGLAKCGCAKHVGALAQVRFVI